MYNLNIFPWHMDAKACVIAATCAAAALGAVCIMAAAESFSSLVTRRRQC